MDGPILTRLFSCKECTHLKTAAIGYNTKKPYCCYHDEIIKNKNGPQLMLGNIGSDKITPEFCPFLFKKTRVEKLKLLQNYEEDVKK